MGDSKADLGNITVIVAGDEELRWTRNVNFCVCVCVCVNVWILWFLWFLYHYQSYSIMLEKSGEYKMDLPLFGLMF